MLVSCWCHDKISFLMVTKAFNSYGSIWCWYSQEEPSLHDDNTEVKRANYLLLLFYTAAIFDASQHIFSSGHTLNIRRAKRVCESKSTSTQRHNNTRKHCLETLLISTRSATPIDQLSRNFYRLSSPTDHHLQIGMVCHRKQYQRQTNRGRQNSNSPIRNQCNCATRGQACMDGCRNTITRGLSWKRWEKNT